MAIKRYRPKLRTTISNRAKYCAAFLNAFFRNLYVEWYNNRLEKKKRAYTAYGTFGSGVVPLGKVNLNQAIEQTSKFGDVINVDVAQAAIFYNKKD